MEEKTYRVRFEIGKYYRHSGGEDMFIVGGVITTLYGGCLVAESNKGGDLKPVGMDEDAATNWREIDKSQWMENFSR